MSTVNPQSFIVDKTSAGIMGQKELIPHLFRREYRKIVSVLCKRFGLEQIEIAEDIAGDTFLAAAELWPREGVPEHPEAWLFRVAKNKAINRLKRISAYQNKIVPGFKEHAAHFYDDHGIDSSPANIKDSQLKMMFAICHPSIPVESQVALSLRILCGFGVEEIADAFLTNKETINKRLYRAKKKLRDENVEIAVPDPEEIDRRLGTVLATIYLLFNEGYHSVSQNKTIRNDLCTEATRLCFMLVENEATKRPEVYAMLALMCLHASRFEARLNKEGDVILYDEQDTELWNEELIGRGSYYLKESARGDCISVYHLEASIAWWHTQKADSDEKWENILKLYNQLLQVKYSPVAALNRTFALSKVKGKEKAINEAEKLKLTDNHFYFVLLGELYTGIDNQKAAQHFEKALSLAKTLTDKRTIQKKIDRQ
jgi:RNA polymerase sigma factor (sigma-70 family)